MAGTVHVELDDRVRYRDRGPAPFPVFVDRVAALEAAALSGKPLEIRLADGRTAPLRWWSSVAESKGMRVRWEFQTHLLGVVFGFVQASDRSAMGGI